MSPFFHGRVIGLVALLGIACSCAAAPVVHDLRLESNLSAADPALVTPIGMPNDARDRGIFIESHTHQFLAAQNLDPQFAATFHSRAEDRADQLPHTNDVAVIEKLVRDASKPTKVRALAVARLPVPPSPAHEILLLELARSREPDLAREAIRTLARSGSHRVHAELTNLALNRKQRAETRAEALLALSWAHEVDTAAFLPLLDDPNFGVRLETVRLLSRGAEKETVRAALQKKLAAARSRKSEVAFAQRLDHALHPPGVEAPGRVFARPSSPAEWQRTLRHGGDAKLGERLFFSPALACSGCHTIENRGGKPGPDLSNIGRSLTREQIIDSILRPSAQVAPQWQTWFVETTDGETYEGWQLEHKERGRIELFTTAGRPQSFKGSEIARYGVLERSLMPEGLEAGLTVEDFRSLVAFLASLK